MLFVLWKKFTSMAWNHFKHPLAFITFVCFCHQKKTSSIFICRLTEKERNSFFHQQYKQKEQNGRLLALLTKSRFNLNDFALSWFSASFLSEKGCALIWAARKDAHSASPSCHVAKQVIHFHFHLLCCHKVAEQTISHFLWDGCIDIITFLGECFRQHCFFLQINKNS